MAEEFPFRHVPLVDLNIGRRVDRYFVLRQLLGAGGMGAAYLAEHELMAHVNCVVKLVLADQANQPAVMARWSTETSACSLLKHENIVRLENFGQLEDGQPFMRFEYIAGTPLNQHVKSQGGRLTVRDATYIIIQVCDALDYAHGCGVVHRDLKPDNLMIEIDPPGAKVALRVKVLDFGIAKVASAVEQTAAGAVMGTPGYMAPEQATNAAAATGKADVFALATVFYRAVTGVMPWGPVESPIAICMKQLSEPPATPPVSLMSPEVAAVVLRALSVRADDRPTMKEFAQQLAAAIPAERHLPSGIEILREIKRTWANSWPAHGPTVPRPIEDPDADAQRLLRGGDAPREIARSSVHPVNDIASTVAPPSAADLVPRSEIASVDAPLNGAGALVDEPKRRGSRSDLLITANVRRRSGATSLAAAERATLTPASSPSEVLTQGAHQQAPLISAALPTGLFSQRFAAQDPPPDSLIREQSIIVASEFEMAIGTPAGPHGSSQLPAVVVSNTLLTQDDSMANMKAAVLVAGTSSPQATSADRESARTLEPPPFVVLPRSPHRLARRIWIAAAMMVCATAAAVGFGMARRSASNDDAGAMSIAERRDAPAASIAERRDVPVASYVAAPHTDGAERAGATPPAVALATPTAPAGAAIAATAPPAAGAVPAIKVTPSDSTGDRPSSAQLKIALAAGTQKSGSSTASDASRDPSPRPPTGQAAKPAAEIVAPAGDGELVISVRPWAAVWINGRSIPDGTPYRGKLAAGHYRVRLVNEDSGQNEVIPVTIEPHKTKTIERKW